MKVSLLISTYNWPEALTLCLKSVAAQRTPPFEVVIADDGSGEPTRRVVEAFARTLPCPVKHIWHEDDGFRLTVIRNKAIAACEGDYIVQIDGDVILHRNFIRDHAAFARKGTFVVGSRAMIDERLARRMLCSGNPKVAWYTPGVKHWLNVLYIPALTPLFRNRENDRLRGCNMAFWREDLVAVNGYNETMIGWGYEDAELVIRLRNNHCTRQTLKFAGFVFHIHHARSSQENDTENRAIGLVTRTEKKIRCEKGLDQYL